MEVTHVGDESRLRLLCKLYISLVWVYKVRWTNKIIIIIINKDTRLIDNNTNNKIIKRKKKI